jgi:hypothetical protein
MAKSNKKRNLGLTGVKTLLLTGSLVGVVGFWNLFAYQDNLKESIVSQQVVELPAESPPGVMLDLPPVPTLIPTDGTAPAPSDEPTDDQNLQLRSVSAPSQQTVQGSNPQIVGGNAGGSTSHARTGSSR